MFLSLPYDDTPDEDYGPGTDEIQFAARLVDVSRVYTLGRREIHALRGVSLDVRPGEFLVVSGHSGSGKTTLLNIIGCIDFATEGRVLVMDVPIYDYDEKFRATFRLTNTGYIFQSYNLVSTLTALENVMFPMQLTEQTESELRDRALEILSRVGLAERADHLPWQLSSGEQQRVAIARAIANDPPIILADEPTANLDVESSIMIRQIFRTMHAAGKTLIVMTHDADIMNLKGVRRLKMENGVLLSND